MWSVGAEIWMVNVILDYTFSGNGRKIFKFLYYTPQLLLAVLAAFQTNVSEFFFNANALFPFTQLSNFARLNFIAANTGKEIHFSNLSEPLVAGTTINMRFNLTMVVLLTFVHFLVVIYIWPLRIEPDGENPLKWYYPCVCGCLRKRQRVAEDDDLKEKLLDEEEDLLPTRPKLLKALSTQTQIDRNKLLQEEELKLVELGKMESLTGNESEDRLVINKLVKKFGKKVAVNNLSMTVFKNEILVLLGHNGAGKTTTISMLIGDLKPTSGTATAFGVDLFSEEKKENDFIGICPQQDVLFEKLTVQENLEFYARFKGMENYQVFIDE